MKKKKLRLLPILNLFTMCFLITLQGCDLTDGQKQELKDGSPISEITHGGKYLGRSGVWSIDWSTKKADFDGFYSVYKRSDNEYIIDYDGKNIPMQKLGEDIEIGDLCVLKYSIGDSKYVEDLP